MLYRIIVENSPMTNNDERIYYKENSVEIGLVCPGKGKVVVCRPVYDIEIEKGLKTDNVVGLSIFDEKTPDITSFFDGLYKMKHYCDAMSSFMPDFNINQLVNYFASQYYDCMDGGLSGYIISMIREISKRDDVDMDMKVYPGKDDITDNWYTLQDFLDSAKDTPSLENIKDMIQKKIPNIDKFLLDSQH